MPTLDWIGKQAVVNHHREVPYRLIHCDGALSVGDKEAGNLLVQGDNLEALRALLPYYAGSVKCIYIDPPYNTGNESWAYNDNVTSPEMRTWLGQVVGKEAEDLSRHDKWLCMMYPRLRLLRDFLREDGLILVSIDDNEVQSLRMIMDDIFGKNRFVAQFVWNTDGHTDNQFPIKINHEYIVVYARNPNASKFGYVIDPNTREESNVWSGFAENSITKNGPRNPPSEILLPIGFPIMSEDQILDPSDLPDGLILCMENEKLSSNPLKKRFPGVQFPLRFDRIVAEQGKLKEPCRVYSGWANADKLREFIASGCKPVKGDSGEETVFFLSQSGVIYYRKTKDGSTRNIVSVLRNFSTTEKMRSELEGMGLFFSYPKPKELISYLIQIAAGKDDLILDSFAGSGTTGHAVMELNKQDQGNRRFILVEMDENTSSNITAKRLRNVITGYDKKDDPSKHIDGLGSGFRFCRLGLPLFDEFGDVATEVSFPDLAAHIFFSETGVPIPNRASSEFLGIHQGRAIYLLFNEAHAQSPREAAGNVLTPDRLNNLPLPSEKFDGVRIVYAEGCTVSSDRLKAYGVLFKQIPYQVDGV